MKLGYGNYGMPRLPLREALAATAAVGYDGLELCCLPTAPGAPAQVGAAERRELRQLLADLPLELPALMLGLNAVAADPAAELAALQAAIELAGDLASGPPPVLVTTTGGAPGQWPAQRQQLVEALGTWAACCQAAGMVLAIEPHVGGLLHRPEQAVWVRQQVNSPALQFNYDHSHFVLRDISVAEAAGLMLPHAAATHVKDAAGDAQHVTFLLPGEGDFDYPDFVRQLAALGYQGYLTVEVSGMVSNRPDYDPLASAQFCYDVLQRALDAAGVARG
ncbi:MAG: sugar phosphate isomerase/epimerase [Fimbriimonadaceae bacterium]|nr:sugar phosphate isomerase/epimerase [Fimbriimonadaceae bacterium]